MVAKNRAVRVVILGAAGRDFHNFNVVYRDDPAVEVVAFTAAQIPGIANRRYPAALAGKRYPQGIPIVAEADLREGVAKVAASLVFQPRSRTASAVMPMSRKAAQSISLGQWKAA